MSSARPFRFSTASCVSGTSCVALSYFSSVILLVSVYPLPLTMRYEDKRTFYFAFSSRSQAL